MEPYNTSDFSRNAFPSNIYQAPKQDSLSERIGRVTALTLGGFALGFVVGSFCGIKWKGSGILNNLMMSLVYSNSAPGSYMMAGICGSTGLLIGLINQRFLC